MIPFSSLLYASRTYLTPKSKSAVTLLSKKFSVQDDRHGVTFGITRTRSILFFHLARASISSIFLSWAPFLLHLLMARLNILHVNMSILKLSYFYNDLPEQEFHKFTFIYSLVHFWLFLTLSSKRNYIKKGTKIVCFRSPFKHVRMAQHQETRQSEIMYISGHLLMTKGHQSESEGWVQQVNPGTILGPLSQNIILNL